MAQSLLDRLWDVTLDLSSWQLAVLTIVIVIICRLLALCVYNQCFHPLNSVPGPRWARILPFYMTIPVVKGRRAHSLLSLHEIYGPCVRIAPNEVSISSYKAYRQIYSHTGSVKTDFYRSAMLLGHDNIFTMRNKSQHAARRKMQNQAYSQQAINDNEGAIVEMSQRLVDRMTTTESEKGTTTVDVLPLCGLIGFEVICRVAFNQDIGARSTDEALAMLRYMENTSKTFPLTIIFPFLSGHKLRGCYLGEYLPGKLGYNFAQRRRWEQATRRMFDEFRRETKSNAMAKRLLATSFVTEQDEFLGRLLSEDEAIEEAMGLTFAGSGTTSTTIAYILYHLSKPGNAPIQDRLRKEVHSAMGTSSTPTLSEVKDLPYLNCVIKEAMRLNPSLIGTLPRTLLSPVVVDDTDEKRGGKVVLPAGTTISMQNYVHQRDASVYNDPHSFIPERWLDLAPSSDAEKAFTPFSLGPRNCIGQNLAKTELLLATSTIFSAVEVRLNSAMRESEMEMVDRFAAGVAGGRLLLDVRKLAK